MKWSEFNENDLASINHGLLPKILVKIDRYGKDRIDDRAGEQLHGRIGTVRISKYYADKKSVFEFMDCVKDLAGKRAWNAVREANVFVEPLGAGLGYRVHMIVDEGGLLYELCAMEGFMLADKKGIGRFKIEQKNNLL